eukprot:scaffold384060_cov45-Prasinocladus_malaysianus.AAC.1
MPASGHPRRLGQIEVTSSCHSLSTNIGRHQGLFRDAEKQFKSAIKQHSSITTILELCKVRLPCPSLMPCYKCPPLFLLQNSRLSQRALAIAVSKKVYIRLDQPSAALDQYLKASEEHTGEVSLLLGAARVYDALNDMNRGVQFYKRV